ncbi:MAG: efflux RND transporter periplasmic adaptor subunit [Sphingomonadaceae bacterium]|nr:efflux RND transporter periplasmic adaptor subunit [Sphingomonadaceae bacterium]
MPLVLILGAGGALLFAQQAPRAHAAPPPAPTAPGTFRPTDAQWRGLAFATAEARDFAPTINSDGVIQGDETRTIPIFSPFTGRIARVFVESGQHVARGAPLFAVQAAELVQAAADLRTAEAQRAAARTALDVASAAYDRQQRLLAGGATATKDAQAAAVDRANAQNALAAADASLTAARGRLAVLGQTGAGRDATGVVRAPVGGTITTRSVGAGQFVQSAAGGAATPLLTLTDLSRVWLVANLREADATRVRPGDRIEARVAGLPGRSFTGTITTVGATVDPASRRITARATIDNPGGMLRPGMFASMRVLEGTADRRVSVPEQAVVYEGDGARLWIARPDRTLALRQITVGRSDGGQVEVLAGLSPGDRVVTAGSLFIDRAAHAE